MAGGCWTLLILGLLCVQLYAQLQAVGKTDLGFELGFTSEESGEEKHPCNRKCFRDTPRMTCEYNFTVEWFLSMSKACQNCPFVKYHCTWPSCIPADGKMRPLITINRKIPGPPIEVCEGDNVIVWVTNQLEDGETTSIHWHGIHQVNSQYMDGVGQITQCPIGVKEIFKYSFNASPVGTHWYHSHTGIQSAEGLNGAIIVRQPLELDPNGNTYDHDLSEHVVIVSDWPVTFPTAMTQHLFMMHDIYDSGEMSGLVNGKRCHYNVSKENREPKQTPLEVFNVRKGQRYRFRFIGANANCPFMIAFEGHKVMVVANDGSPVVPRIVDYFNLHPGERYDFVLTADQPVGKYWLKVVGLGSCYKQRLLVNAVIRYSGAPEHHHPAGVEAYVHKSGVMLNPTFYDAEPGEKRYEYGYNQTWIQTHDLRHAGSNNDYTHEHVDVKMYIGMNFLKNDDMIYNKNTYPASSIEGVKALFTPTLDNITFNIPPVPILSQPEDVDESWFCNRSTISHPLHCLHSLCLCTHMIRLPLNAVVEVVLFNTGKLFAESGHPMHLHGYSYRLLGSGKINKTVSRDSIIRLDEQGKLTRNFINPPIRDTVNVGSGGYAIIRFKADNPGIWLFHCHTEGHLLQGQALLFKVGEYSDLPLVTKEFARCGGYGFSNAKKKTQSSTNKGSSGPISAKEKIVSSTNDGSHTCGLEKCLRITLMTLTLLRFSRY